MAVAAKKEHLMSDLRTFTWYDVPADQLSSDLWSFLLRWIGPTLYVRRTKMGINIEGNGFELWRKYCFDHAIGAVNAEERTVTDFNDDPPMPHHGAAWQAPP